jgi:hypothetical protein
MPQIELTVGVETQNTPEDGDLTTPTREGWFGWAARRPGLHATEGVEA